MTPVLWTLVDKNGRTWKMAGQMDVARSGDTEIELSDAVDLGFRVTEMRAVVDVKR